MDYILYIDEAGCLGRLPSHTSNVQPIFCITGLIIPQRHLQEITMEFLEMKQKFNPQYRDSLNHDLDIALYEIKGSNLRRDIRSGSRNKKRRAFGILDRTLDLLEKYDCKILARGYIKQPCADLSGRSVYTASIQSLCYSFNNFLEDEHAQGIVVADSRRKIQNNQVSYSILTRKFKQSGDEIPRIIEMPLFGHSENHVGLQISDWLASALLFPMMSHAYCRGHVRNVHVNSLYGLIQPRYSKRLQKLQYRYYDHLESKYKGGITVIDGILKSRSAALMFR